MEMTACPSCGGSGWKIVERDGASGAERCQCQRIARASALEERAGIPPLYREASLDNFNLPRDNPIHNQGLTHVKNTVRSYAWDYPIGSRPGLLLMGNPGTGKTHLAVAALRILISRGFEGAFLDFQGLLSRIRAGYDRNSSSSDQESLRAALETEILLIDDLGAHRVKEFVQDTITEIITYRCNHKKPIIATTNLPDDTVRPPRESEELPTGGATVQREKAASDYAIVKLGERIGERACSRLFETCRILPMPWVEDYRRLHSKIHYR